MSRLPNLDTYDLQGVRPEEAALWGGDFVYELDDADSFAGLDVDDLA